MLFMRVPLLLRCMTDKPKLIAIVGPTASGKTSLSISLAQKCNGEVVSADSRQVYRGLNIGTGKVTKEEMQSVPHHLLDVADPNTMYTVTDFVHDGRKAIEEILDRKHLPIIVGGTFLYVDALLGDVSTPEVPPNEQLRRELEEYSTEKLVSLLEEKDPERAQSIDRKNKRRLIRALEIAETLGVVPKTETEDLYNVLRIGIQRSKETLEQNIHERLITRLNHGMIEEVVQLHSNGLSYERLGELGIEYRYIGEYLQDKVSKEEMCTQIELKSLQYAKRQMTWLKKSKEVVWLNENIQEHAETLVRDFLE